MKTTGRHLLVEYQNCDHDILNDLNKIENLMKQAAVFAGASIVGTVFHPFSPQGVSGVVVIEESHLSIHTWPEHGYAAVDFYTCGDCNPERAHEFLKNALRAECSETMTVMRGLGPSHPSLKTLCHNNESMETGAEFGSPPSSATGNLNLISKNISCSARR